VDYDREDLEMERRLKRQSFELNMQKIANELQKERVQGIKDDEEFRALQEKHKRGIEEEKMKFGSNQKAYSNKMMTGSLSGLFTTPCTGHTMPGCLRS
jgi:hypothetical protein